MTLALAIILGLFFGFVLQKVGAANPQRIINMLRLRDFQLMKVILLGIGLSSLGLFILLAAGAIDGAHLSVKSSYVGVIVGGGVLGLGWAISGFCPGTGVVAAGAGRRDALSFIVGGLVGALLFMLLYEAIKDTALFDTLGGKATLAETGQVAFEALWPSLPGLLVAGAIAAVLIGAAWILPDRRASRPTSRRPNQHT